MENCRSDAFQVSQKLYIMTGVYNNKYKNTTKLHKTHQKCFGGDVNGTETKAYQ